MLMTALAELVLTQIQQKLFLLIVVHGVAFQAGEFLMAGILPHEILVALAATLPYHSAAGVGEAEDLAGIAVAVHVRPSGAVAGFAAFPGSLVEQALVSGAGERGKDLVVAGLANVGTDIRGGGLFTILLGPHRRQPEEENCQAQGD